MISTTTKDAVNRISYIEGHLAGVKKMVEEDRYCVDILKQTYAIRRAIEKLESNLLDGHLHSCVVEGVRDDERALAEQGRQARRVRAKAHADHERGRLAHVPRHELLEQHDVDRADPKIVELADKGEIDWITAMSSASATN